ncbi:MAG: LEPR-XLL domain-containing protein, partial [Phycisphaera sp.]|nr:LEPR-XLL domain-containing protein [Phycisphaera sp.]
MVESHRSPNELSQAYSSEVSDTRAKQTRARRRRVRWHLLRSLAGMYTRDVFMRVMRRAAAGRVSAWTTDRWVGLEPLEPRLLLSSDFGDLPSPYATLAADGGAEHTIGTLMLGSSVDGESDGVPSANADGDGGDEDGVTFGSLQVGQLDATVTVNVQGAAGKLDAWIDFNGDGSFGGPGE